MMTIPRAATYDAVYGAFRWQIPERFNIATLVCDRHAGDATRVALIHQQADGSVRRYSFLEMARASNRIANLLQASGLQPGERVALLLGQDPEVPMVHLGAWKAGMISLPLSRLFGDEALVSRLGDSGAAVLVTDRDGYAKVAPLRDRLPALRHIWLVDGEESGAASLPRTLEAAADSFAALQMAPDTPAYMNYTSGTTGQPKGVLKGHASILGLLPAVEFANEFFPQPGDLAWSPADWSWMAGMTNVLFASWYHAVPVLAFRSRGFDGEEVLTALARHEVRNALLTPTMLKMLRQLPDPTRFGARLRSITSGSEAVGAELMDWSRRNLGVGINVVFGQTECNMVLVNNQQVMTVKPGSLGRPAPGHRVAIVDDDGRELPPGEQGQIAIRRPDPLMMLGYWNDPAATARKFAGDWMLTGDIGSMDEEGYFWFHSRGDDLILSAGYRIGPSEVEEVLLRHPAVALVAVIGVPDPQRQEAVKAFVVPAAGARADAALAAELQEHVKRRLARHEYPREVEFVESLPMTATGKIMRAELRRLDALRRAERAPAG